MNTPLTEREKTLVTLIVQERITRAKVDPDIRMNLNPIMVINGLQHELPFRIPDDDADAICHAIWAKQKETIEQ